MNDRALLTVGLLAGLWIGWSDAGAQQVYRGTTELVSVYATVADADGRLVPDLTKDDFEILDNGRPQPITFFSAAAQPFSVVIMLDRSGSMFENHELVRGAAAAFIEAMAPDDRARIGHFADDIFIEPAAFTSDRTALRQALDRGLQMQGPSPLWTAVDRSMTALQAMPDRRVVLVLTDGRDAPGVGQIRTPLSDLMRRTRVNGVMTYAIGFWSEASGPYQRVPDTSREPPDPGLRELAAESGGGYLEWRDGSSLEATFLRVAEELHRQYWLGYAPPQLDGKEHSIEVRVRGSGRTVRARRHYVATPKRW